MPTAQPPFGTDGPWTLGRRLLTGLVVLLVVASLAVLTARWRSGGSDPHATPTATSSPSTAPAGTSPTPGPSAPASSASAVTPPGSGPVRTQSPTDYAKAFAAVLWSYDTRTTGQAQHLGSLKQWLTGESKYADPDAVQSQVPTADVWQQMRNDRQYATSHVAEAHIPAAFTQAVTANPAALTTAYIYAVTVTGTQSIFWTGSGHGTESRAVTLAVQCRPSRNCALASIANTVYP